MYCTRLFRIHEEKEMKNLLHVLSNGGFEYEIHRPTKKNHLNTTPKNQQYKAIVSWNDVQNSEA